MVFQPNKRTSKTTKKKKKKLKNLHIWLFLFCFEGTRTGNTEEERSCIEKASVPLHPLLLIITVILRVGGRGATLFSFLCDAAFKSCGKNGRSDTDSTACGESKGHFNNRQMDSFQVKTSTSGSGVPSSHSFEPSLPFFPRDLNAARDQRLQTHKSICSGLLD